MPSIKRKPAEIDGIEELPSKRRRLNQDAPNFLTAVNRVPVPEHPVLPSWSRPRGFLGLFTHIPDFQKGLLEVGGLTAYDYTRLRMSCRTIAEAWKPYPHKEFEPDSKDPYFAGLCPVACNEEGCRRTSDKVPIRRCYGRYHPGIFSGCNKYLCLYCVWTAQRDFDQHKIEGNELHYCRPCSKSFNRHRTGPASLKQCECGFKNRDNIHKQPYSEWQCSCCRASLNKMLSHVARHNLINLEAQELVAPRDRWLGPYMHGLARWIDTAAINRNNCPGCGRWYGKLVKTYHHCDNNGHWPRDMVRQCVVCLEPRP